MVSIFGIIFTSSASNSLRKFLSLSISSANFIKEAAIAFTLFFTHQVISSLSFCVRKSSSGSNPLKFTVLFFPIFPVSSDFTRIYSLLFSMIFPISFSSSKEIVFQTGIFPILS